jgi:hypothetical protein
MYAAVANHRDEELSTVRSRYLRAAIQLDPGNPARLTRSMGECYRDTGDLDKRPNGFVPKVPPDGAGRFRIRPKSSVTFRGLGFGRVSDHVGSTPLSWNSSTLLEKGLAKKGFPSLKRFPRSSRSPNAGKNSSTRLRPLRRSGIRGKSPRLAQLKAKAKTDPESERPKQKN